MIGICTDSNAQLPASLVDRYGIEVVPLTVTVNGVAYLEGVDLDADHFYAFFDDGRTPVITTAAPSPGQFAAAYGRLAAGGATEILSVHIGSELSGTLNAARIGAEEANVPVRLVDTHAASFIVSCAVWEAADTIARGGTLDAAAEAAQSVAGRCGNVFVVGTLALARAGGRLDVDAVSGSTVPILRLADGKLETVGEAPTAETAAATMADAVLGSGAALRIGVGDSDPSSRPVADELVRRLRAAPQPQEIVRYRVGPSVGAHTGPGTAGAVYFDRAES